jgi:hypothetical protein
MNQIHKINYIIYLQIVKLEKKNESKIRGKNLGRPRRVTLDFSKNKITQTQLKFLLIRSLFTPRSHRRLLVSL